jgi:hypothetical protein
LKNGGSRRLLNGGHRNMLQKSKINILIILKVFLISFHLTVNARKEVCEISR